jgi:hypothetical protein
VSTKPTNDHLKKMSLMKKTNIIYWISTGLFAFVMLGSAIPDILVVPIAVKGFQDIGLPAYLIPFLGVAKLLGVIALFIPRYPKVREWAYAGLMFDLIGATWSVAMGTGIVSNWIPMIPFIALGFVSYAWYHKRARCISAGRAATPAYQNSQYSNERAKVANAAIS